MLNIIENSDVMQFIDKIEDERMRELLSRMHFEYSSYTQVGTPEECKRYKEWCNLAPSDYMKLLDRCTSALKEELECVERFYQGKVEELEHKLKKRK